MSYVGQYNNCGSRSSFYVIDKKRGFKDFETREHAEYAHRVQSELSMNNLAPLVLSEVGKIRYREDMELSGWGYITEIAQMIGCGGNDCYCGECEDILETKTKSRQLARLLSKITEMGFDFADAHVGNVGYVIRKGKKVLVCIDCGEESIYYYDAEDEYDDNCICSCSHCQKRRNQYA